MDAGSRRAGDWRGPHHSQTTQEQARQIDQLFLDGGKRGRSGVAIAQVGEEELRFPLFLIFQGSGIKPLFSAHAES